MLQSVVAYTIVGIVVGSLVFAIVRHFVGKR